MSVTLGIRDVPFGTEGVGFMGGIVVGGVVYPGQRPRSETSRGLALGFDRDVPFGTEEVGGLLSIRNLLPVSVWPYPI